MNIALILEKRYPNTGYVLVGDQYEGLEWMDSTPKPSLDELEALWPEVQYQVAYDAVSDARLAQYREVSDPIFFQYQRDERTKKEWVDAVEAINEANPYPVKGL